MREAYAGHYLYTIMIEGLCVAVATAPAFFCLGTLVLPENG
ncbi:MAG: hypothetical protein ABSA53_00460 [Streptosporangiaceae bacterium]|jgi:hypothetical protein